MMTKSQTFIFIACFVLCEAALIMWVDRPLSDLMRDLDISHHALIDCFRAVTNFAKSKWYLWPSGLCILAIAVVLRTPLMSMSNRHHIARIGHNFVFFFLSVALSGIVTDMLKPVIGRARPVEWERAHIYGFQPLTFHAVWNGMPSGHATTAAAVATALIIICPRGRILWVFLGIALAASRIMVNAHYLSDVLAGSAVGILTTWFVLRCRDDQGTFPFMKGIFPIDKPAPSS